MPGRIRQVNFSPLASYSRLPADDEKYVMRAFAKHCSHCSQCAHPYQAYKKGKTLCSKGHQRACDVTDYVSYQSGKVYSLVDLEHDTHMEVEIPADCQTVRELLKAVAAGLRLHVASPSSSHGKTSLSPPSRHSTLLPKRNLEADLAALDSSKSSSSSSKHSSYKSSSTLKAPLDLSKDFDLYDDTYDLDDYEPASFTYQTIEPKKSYRTSHVSPSSSPSTQYASSSSSKHRRHRRSKSKSPSPERSSRTKSTYYTIGPKGTLRSSR